MVETAHAITETPKKSRQKNGKIIKSLTFYNEADALEQLGYVFINPEDL